MRKLIHILVLAVLAASCTKTEVHYAPSQAITIAPVTGKMTKAAVEGAPYGQELKIYANYTDGKAYMNGAIFNEKTTAGIWEGKDDIYFWPKSGQIKLAGHTNIVATYGTPAYDYTNNKITVPQFIQPLSTATAVDFLWFNQTDPVNNNDSGTSLEVDMQHAMAWVTIKAYGVGGSVGWQITSIRFDDVLNKGTLTCTSTGAEWSGVAAENSGADLQVYTGEYTLRETATAVETRTGGTLLIPQTPTQMTITYKTSGGAEQEKPLNLKISDTPGDNKWEAGKHYVYTLLFNPYKIDFSVSVDGSWTNNGDITIN